MARRSNNLSSTSSNPQTVNLNQFNDGGLSDSRWSGTPNSYYKLTGLDPHSTPGLLDVAQKLTKISSTTVTEFCKEKVISSNGMIYWFSYTSGKIWQQNPTTDSFELIYTTVPTTGGAGCLGAYEYQGTIYWATEDYLHKIVALANDTAAEWTTNAVPNWEAFDIGDSLFHPMLELNLVLYIGDGNYVAQVDAGTFTGDALDIASPLRVKCLGKISTDLLIGTWVSNTITQTELIRWNTYSVSFTSSDTIPEVGINAFIPADNYVIVQAGLAGNIYQYNGESLSLYKSIPGTYDPTHYATVNPSSVGNLNGQMLFGVSNGTGNPCDLGVYRLARHDAKYNFILDFPYPISARDDSSQLVITNVEIGAIAVSGFNVYVAWKKTVPGDAPTYTYGIDKLDYSAKLELAYWESRVMLVKREELSTFQDFTIDYYLIPSGCNLVLSASKNYAAYAALTSVIDTQRNTVSADDGGECTTLSVKCQFTVSGNTAPRIESGVVTLK